MAEIKIERLEGKGYTAEVISPGMVFSTYRNFAVKAGYPDAAAQIKPTYLHRLSTVEVLARGNHENNRETLYVVQTEAGVRFIVGAGGLKIKEPTLLADANIEELTEELRKRSYNKGYEDGLTQGGTETDHTTRDEVVEGAKADVLKLKARMGGEIGNSEGNDIFRHRVTAVEFIVNKEKRTVVALVRGKHSNRLYERGIAKCEPNDCFNAHIGKAIALRRALGLNVPTEYFNAPAPEGAQIGDVVFISSTYPRMTVARTTDLFEETIRIEYASNKIDIKVVDDSARYE